MPTEVDAASLQSGTHDLGDHLVADRVEVTSGCRKWSTLAHARFVKRRPGIDQAVFGMLRGVLLQKRFVRIITCEGLIRSRKENEREVLPLLGKGGTDSIRERGCRSSASVSP